MPRTEAPKPSTAAIADKDLEALRIVFEGTASSTGDEFFRTLVEHLAKAIGMHHAFVSEFTPPQRIRTLAFWSGDRIVDNIEYDLPGTPCQEVIDGGFCFYPSGLQKKYPETEPGIESYLGVPLTTRDGRILGHLCALDETPFPHEPQRLALFRIFAARAGAELDRIRMEKEIREQEIRDVTKRLLFEQEQAKLKAQNLYLQEELKSVHNFEEIVGASGGLLKVLERVNRVAPTDSTVLITGESGTGKELIARAIHSASQRAEKPFIKINCAALPTSLVESELFGHERGAFSGAIQRRIGRFELANGGTIFLDEIGEVPLDVQVKLLRVLQEQEFERIGGNATIKTDVRVIAATNRDFAKSIRENHFRADLYYRLNVFPIELPPLRARKEDIALLAHFFVQKYAPRIGRRIEAIDAESMRRLIQYDWPGNIRELENIIERAIILANSATLHIDAEILPASMMAATASIDNARSASPQDSTMPADLASIQRDHILAMLRETNWVIEGQRGAANRLGMKPGTLRHRMKKLGIARAAG